MRIDFLQTGGYRLETDTLKLMQDAYSLFHSLGEVIGNKSIIKGCNVLGNTVSDGVIYLNGELLFFQGGQTQTKVIVTETVENLTFLDGESKPTFYKRKASFGTGIDAILWSEFSRPFDLLSITSRVVELEKQNAVFQADGAMVLWNKPAADIPTGWQEVLDWRGRMPIGWKPNEVEFDTVGKVGGQKMKTLTEAELPKISPVPPTSFLKGGSYGGSGGITRGDYPTGPYSAGELIKPFGGDQPFSIMNPYRVVMFIEYVG